MDAKTLNRINGEVVAGLSGADKIRLLLNHRGFTFKQFAKEYNLWVQEVSDFVNGREDSEDVAKAVADSLGLTIEDVFALRGQEAAANAT